MYDDDVRNGFKSRVMILLSQSFFSPGQDREEKAGTFSENNIRFIRVIRCKNLLIRLSILPEGQRVSGHNTGNCSQTAGAQAHHNGLFFHPFFYVVALSV